MANRFVNQERNRDQLQAFVSQINGRDRMGFSGLVHAMTIRIPVDVFSYVEGLAKQGAMTRNQVAAELMAQGLAVVLSELDRTTAEEVTAHAVEVLSSLFPDMKPGEAVEVLSYGMGDA